MAALAQARECRRREGGAPVTTDRAIRLSDPALARHTSGFGGYLIPALGRYAPSAGMTVLGSFSLMSSPRKRRPSNIG
jgi:hypothetical protein